MMLLIVVISVIAFALLNVFAKNKAQTVFSLILGLVFVLSLTAMMANLTSHFGMEKETITKTQTLVSSSDSDQMDLLLYQPLGDGTEKIYLYRTDESQEKPKQTRDEYVTNHVVENAESAQKETKTTRWTYKSDFYRLLFGIADNDKQFIKEENTFSIPDSWALLTVDQAKKLASLAEEQQESMKTEAQAYIQEKMQAALTADPTMDEAEQKAKISEFTAEYQKEAMAKLIEEAKK
jgi:hypothetical protein